MREDYLVILVTTAHKKEAERIASALIEQKLIACANILSGISSIFRWKGKICREQEAILIMKTTFEKFEDIVAKIKELHSYEVPEIISLPVIKGNKDYLDWVKNSMC